MSIENEWREELRRKRDAKKSLNEIITYSLRESPKTRGEILKSIAMHRTNLPSPKQLSNILDDYDHIVEFESLFAADGTPSKSLGSGATPIKYGLTDRVNADLGSTSENLTYLNRSTFFHLNKNNSDNYSTV